MTGRLFKNELIKIFSRWSWRGFTALIVLLGFGVPVYYSSLLPPINDVPEYYSMEDYEYYSEMSKNAPKGSADTDNYKAVAEAHKLLAENNVKRRGVWSTLYYDDYIGAVSAVTALEQVESGMDIETVADTHYFYGVRIYYDYSFNSYVIENSKNKTVILDRDTAPALKAEYMQIKEKAEKLIKADNTEIAKDQILMLTEELTQEKIKLSEARAIFNSDRNKAMDYYSERLLCEVLNAAIEGWESFKNCSRENEEWIAYTLKYLLYNSLTGYHVDYFSPSNGDSEFLKRTGYAYGSGGNMFLGFNSYEEYLSFYDQKTEDYILGIKTLLYSVQNEIPTEYAKDSDERFQSRTMQESLNTVIYIVMFFCMLMASEILSSEYSGGTVRLLMIRPVARWKILLSKLLTVTVYGAVMLVIACGCSMATVFMLFDEGDLFDQLILSGNGEIWCVTHFNYILGNLWTVILPLVFTSALAFLLSVIIRKSVFSVVSSVLIFSFGKIVAHGTAFILYYLPFLRYTVLPYMLDLDGQIYTALERALEVNNFPPDHGLSLTAGTIITALYTVIAAAVSFVVFNRQEIKS